MHPMFVTLFLQADAEELLTEEQDRQRRARQARRGGRARVIRTAGRGRDRPRRPDR
jgi:hypothetical protein